MTETEENRLNQYTEHIRNIFGRKKLTPEQHAELKNVLGEISKLCYVDKNEHEVTKQELTEVLEHAEDAIEDIEHE